MSALTINKIFCFFFFLFLSCHLVSQDKTYTKVQRDSLRFLESEAFKFGKLNIKNNNFYYNEKKVTKNKLLNLVNTQIDIYAIDKVKISENINLFYKFKNNKNLFPVIAVSTIILGSVFGFLSIREGGKTDAVIVAGIFGGVSIGFATSAVINNVKFIKKKRELLKQLALK